VIASNQTFIIAAYAVTWLVLLGYMARLVRKGARARASYERMPHQHSAGAQR
jgi:CcmD family protein